MSVQTDRLLGQELLQIEEQAFQRAVAAAAPAVVRIETFGNSQGSVQELTTDGPTTGTIVSPDGWIISSLFSFREQPASILVTLPDGQRTAARIVSRDFSRELVWLKVDANDLPTAQPSAENATQVGQWAIALGKTYGNDQVSQSVGIVSALGRAYGKAIQTDAKVSPINYGGPLIDLAGNVLGILSPISPGSFVEGDSTELYDSGVGFAIPLHDILVRRKIAENGADIHSGLLGIVPGEQNELAGPVIVSGASPGSPAAKTGVRAGDVIVSAFGQPIHYLADLKHALGPIDAGDKFRFSVRRADEELQFECELSKDIPIYRRRYLGLRLQPAHADGPVIVTGVEANSPASETKFQAGQTIVKCAGIDNPTEEQLRSLIAVAELDRPLAFTVLQSDGSQLEFDVLATTWPTALLSELPSREPIGDATATIKDITLGDFPNKTFAIVPPASPAPVGKDDDAAAGDSGNSSTAAFENRFGLLILFPEPGELDRQKTLEYWSEFSVRYSWVVVVINSGNPNAWTRDEVELASRVLGKIENSMPLDPGRLVVGGLGVGGRVGLLAAAGERKRISGVLTIGTDLGRFSLRQQNAPAQSLDFMMVGDAAKLAAQTKSLKSAGYEATTVDAPQLKNDKWETIPLEPISKWLEGLARF
ncbi:MAG: PDZ domain-containing protein [Planctomycetales bacterium]|nr:PDZ domain-containing protein [Planctomycetales bacterium]